MNPNKNAPRLYPVTDTFVLPRIVFPERFNQTFIEKNCENKCLRIN